LKIYLHSAPNYGVTFDAEYKLDECTPMLFVYREDLNALVLEPRIRHERSIDQTWQLPIQIDKRMLRKRISKPEKIVTLILEMMQAKGFWREIPGKKCEKPEHLIPLLQNSEFCTRLDG